MAHSIVAAESEQAAKRAKGIYLSDEFHELIWADPTGERLPAPHSYRGYQIGQFPLLSRLTDPYRDATIYPTELAGFRAELGKAILGLGGSGPPAELLRRVIALSSEAEAKGWTVFCHGD